MIRRLFCKHDWEKLWFESSWSSDEPHTPLLATYRCKCKKCGKKKFVCFRTDTWEVVR